MCPFDFEEVVDEAEDFEGYLQKIKESEETVVLDSKNEISRFVEYRQKKIRENKYLKEEYKPFVMKKHIDPINEKIKKNEEDIDFLNQVILSGMEEVGEKTVTFPDIAKITVSTVPESIIYPEDDKAFVEKIVEENPESPFLRKKYELDKKGIKEYYKNNEALPFPELEIKSESKTIKVTDLAK